MSFTLLFLVIGLIPTISGLTLLFIHRHSMLSKIMFVYMVSVSLSQISIAFLFARDLQVSEQVILIMFRLLRVSMFIGVLSLMYIAYYLLNHSAKQHIIIVFIQKYIINRTTILLMTVFSVLIYLFSFSKLSISGLEKVEFYNFHFYTPTFGVYHFIIDFYYLFYFVFLLLLVIIGLFIKSKENRMFTFTFSLSSLLFYTILESSISTMSYLFTFSLLIIIYSLIVQISMVRTVNNMNDKYLKQMKQKEKLSYIENLTYHLVHKAQNGISIIQGYTDMLPLMSDNLTEEQLEVMEQLNKTSNSLSDNFNSYMCFLKKRYDLHFEIVRIKPIVLKTLKVYKQQMQEHNIILNTDIQDVKLYASEEYLKLVFNELIENSIAAMSQNSSDKELTIQIKGTTNSVIINVIDNGVGIERDRWDDIFFPTIKTVADNSFYGLANCSKIVFLHRGIIQIKDSKKGHTRIQIKLPKSKYTSVTINEGDNKK